MRFYHERLRNNIPWGLVIHGGGEKCPQELPPPISLFPSSVSMVMGSRCRRTAWASYHLPVSRAGSCLSQLGLTQFPGTPNWRGAKRKISQENKIGSEPWTTKMTTVAFAYLPRSPMEKTKLTMERELQCWQFNKKRPGWMLQFQQHLQTAGTWDLPCFKTPTPDLAGLSFTPSSFISLSRSLPTPPAKRSHWSFSGGYLPPSPDVL